MGSSPKFRLFFSASGSFAKTIIASRWRGCQYLKRYFTPSNPSSPAQVLVRQKIATAAEAWRQDFEKKIVRDDWDRLASYTASKMSGYNLFTKSAFSALVDDPAVVFTAGYRRENNYLSFTASCLRGFDMPMVSQDIDIWMGYNPWKQNHWDTRAFRVGILWTPPFPGPGTYYIRLTSDGIPISGLIRYVYKDE